MKACLCGRQLADSAKECPNCGQRFVGPIRKVFRFFAWANMLGILFALPATLMLTHADFFVFAVALGVDGMITGWALGVMKGAIR